jgi:4-carboxymuconolactone decarboxylase
MTDKTDAIEPGDHYPCSGARLPLPRREDLLDNPQALAIYDRFVDPKSDTYAGLLGPGGIRLHSPMLAITQQPCNTYIRRNAGITGRERELTILTVARELDSQFEWMAHEEPARKAGISEAIIETLRTRGPLDSLPHDDAVLVRLIRETYADRKVSKPTYAAAIKLFGAKKLIDLVQLMGNYTGTSLVLTIFDVPLHKGKTPRLPPR